MQYVNLPGRSHANLLLPTLCSELEATKALLDTGLADSDVHAQTILKQLIEKKVIIAVPNEDESSSSSSSSSSESSADLFTWGKLDQLDDEVQAS